MNEIPLTFPSSGGSGQFMGHSFDYWINLQKQAENLDSVRLIEEIAQLSAKVYRYEKLIDDMTAVRSTINRRFS